MAEKICQRFFLLFFHWTAFAILAMFHIHNCSHGEEVGEGKEPTRESETRRTNTLWPTRVELETQSNKIEKNRLVEILTLKFGTEFE